MKSPIPETDNVQTTTPSLSELPESQQVQESPTVTEQNDPTKDNSTGQQHRLTITPNPKRRRVARACDECRRGKIKCDGQQPCTHCAVYNHDCTSDQPSRRRRHIAPQHVEGLETQLKRAKRVLSIVCPTLDLENSDIDAHLQDISHHLSVNASHAQPILRDPSVPYGVEGHTPLRPEPTLEPMGQLYVEGRVDAINRSHPAQLRLQSQVRGVDALSLEGPSRFARHRPAFPVQDTLVTFDQSLSGRTNSVLLSDIDLPPKLVVRTLCERALLGTSTLVQVVHVPTFNKSMNRIYETSPEDYGATENVFLPLLHAVLAFGIILSDEAELGDTGYKPSIDEGFKYFRASRRLLHVADCKDLTSLQAIVFMIQFSLSFTKLSTCYTYIGVALRSALHMGLHRSPNASSNPIDAEICKRLFWSIRKMDTFVGTMLGLPIFLSDEDADQDWPTEVDDEYITETSIHSMPEGKTSILAASNAHTKIVQICAKICKYLYPIKGSRLSSTTATNGMISCEKVIELEDDLQEWLRKLPTAFRIGGEVAPTLTRVQHLLQVAYGHAQLLLYRPFLHYLSQPFTTDYAGQRAIVCANACVSASRNIMHIAVGMKKQGLLVAADWLTTYRTFSAVVSILEFVTENPQNPSSSLLYRDANEAKDVLAHLAKRSVAAGRCTGTLATIFDRLHNGVKRGVHSVKA